MKCFPGSVFVKNLDGKQSQMIFTNMNNLRQGFQGFYFKSSLSAIRTGLGTGLVLYALFGLLDISIEQTIVRFAIICPVLIAALSLTWWKEFENISQLVLAAVYLIVCVSIIQIIQYIPSGTSRDVNTAGLMLSIVGASAIRLRRKWMLPSCFVILVFFCLLMDHVVIYLPIFFGTVFLTTMIIASTEHVLKNNYTAMVLLEDERAKLKNVRDDLETANTLKNKLLSVLMHDLRKPNANILAILKEIKKYAPSDEAWAAFAENIQDQLAENERFIENLWHWSIVEVSKEIDKEAVMLRPLVADCVASFANQLMKKGNNLVIDIDEKVLLTNVPLFRTICLNLISNANKYTSNGLIRIFSCFDKEGQLHLTFTDTGIGMEGSTIDKLFYWSSRVSMPGTSNEIGNGLGLLLSREFLSVLGGRFVIDSSPGKGTRITIIFKKEFIHAHSDAVPA